MAEYLNYCSQKTPKKLQNVMQKHAKKNQKNASVVKNALSRRSHFFLNLEPIFAPKFALVLNMFYTFFLPLFRKMLKLILEPILGSKWAKRAKMSPEEPSGASKNQKPSFSKTLKNTCVF